jgi:hypothetical protein
MTEATRKQTNDSMTKDDGHQRFKEAVDTSKTPQEEKDDPRRGDAGRPDATVK